MAGESRQFGPYGLVRRLGVGGMAETFEATRAATGGFEQRVCLKRVLPAYSRDEDFVRRFQREARLAAQLRHSNIVGVIDFGEVDGVPYMALELVDGVELRSFLRSLPDERLTPELVTLVALDLAYALELAHQSIVHRDVSPTNILISRAGETKLADFGIAKAIDNVAPTASQSLQGKIPYMSPEQIRAELVDARSDLFSLGVVLFEAATGVRPFDGAHDVETMQKIVDGRRQALREVAPDVPAALAATIEKLLAIDADERTQSASELLEELATLAPPPHARRELAAIVEAQRGGPATRMHVRAREEERDTELSRPPELVPAANPKDAWHLGETRRQRSRRVPLLLGVSVIALIGGVFAVGSPSRPDATPDDVASVPPAETAPPAVLPEEPKAAATAPQLAGDEPPSAVAKGTDEDRSELEAPSSRGWLHVVVQPWGNVWIDDLWMGRAPVKARVSKGRHVVKVGRELPSETRVVKIEAGARKEVEISLAD